MEIETKIISMQTLKPSSPTPKPLQKHLLSSIDQSLPQVFNPLLYFYVSNPEIPDSDRSERLKKSLSAVLFRFYPLAGSIAGNHYVDCNDAGTPFFEAEASCDLSHVIPLRDHGKIMEKFLPYKGEDHHDFCLAVQATYFRCGGIAIGIILSHKIADGFSTFMFINEWAAAARGDDGPPLLPRFDAAAFFPPLQDTSCLDPTRMVVKKEELATRIFTFPAAEISLLRERYSGGGSGHRPSRVEALSAFIWTQFASATKARSDQSKIHIVSHAINIRSRVDPPLSKYHFGNIVGLSAAAVEAGDSGAELVLKIREVVKGVNRGYLASEDAGEGNLVSVLQFSSLCGYPVYEADFGWGRPVWAGLVRLPFKNTVIFTDTESGGGIEALVHLKKQDMDKFVAQLELQMLKSNL